MIRLRLIKTNNTTCNTNTNTNASFQAARLRQGVPQGVQARVRAAEQERGLGGQLRQGVHGREADRLGRHVQAHGCADRQGELRGV